MHKWLIREHKWFNRVHKWIFKSFILAFKVITLCWRTDKLKNSSTLSVTFEIKILILWLYSVLIHRYWLNVILMIQKWRYTPSRITLLCCSRPGTVLLTEITLLDCVILFLFIVFSDSKYPHALLQKDIWDIRPMWFMLASVASHGLWPHFECLLSMFLVVNGYQLYGLDSHKNLVFWRPHILQPGHVVIAMFLSFCGLF